MLTLKNVLFTPLYAAHVLGKPLGSFLLEMAPVFAVTLATATVARIVALSSGEIGWTQLIGAGLGLSLLYSLVVFRVVLSPEEREMIKAVLRKTT